MLGLHAPHGFHGYARGAGGEDVPPDDYCADSRETQAKATPDSQPQPAPEALGRNCPRRRGRSGGLNDFGRFNGDFLHAT
jgi:hypothetical protein